jgi:hypothetical protein
VFPEGNSFFKELQFGLDGSRVEPGFPLNKKWFDGLSLGPVAGAGWQPVFNNGDHNEKSFDSVNTRLSHHHVYHVLRAKFS